MGGARAGSGGSSTPTGNAGSGGSAGSGGGSGAGGSGGSATGGSGGAVRNDAGPGRPDRGADVGRRDASASDGPVANPAPVGDTCAGVMARYCDDWEKQTAGQAPAGDFEVSTAGNASVVVDTAQHFSGTKSLHFRGMGGNSKAQLEFTEQFPIPNSQHGRLMLLMPKKPTTGSHWDIVQSDNSANNQWAWGGQAGVFELVVDPPDNGIDSATQFPEGMKWYCIQWEFKNPGNTYTVKLDGEFVKPTPVTNRMGWISGAWENLLLGWIIFGSSAADFWIDDLAFGDREIACPAM